MSYKPTIMVVDDTESNIDMLMAMLKNYDVIPATSGAEAIEIAKEEKIDLLLLDIIMDGLDGFETCKRLKEDGQTKDIPIIFITAKSDEDSIEEGYAIGGVDYVTKPFKPRELLARVKTHLELKRYRDELEDRVQEEISKRVEQERALIKSARLAEVGEMIGAITHQWKQPLSGIQMVATMLIDDIKEEGLKGEEAVDMLGKIAGRVSFLLETINDFKNFFKEDRAKTSFDAYSEAIRVIDLITPQINSAGIKIINDIDKDLTVIGYKNEFKHVLLNIINNAKDAIVKKRGRDEARFIRLDSAIKEGFVTIKIEDNGGGVRQEIIDKIFEPQFSTKGDEGSGIGLSISKIIIQEHHGGKIDVYNTDKGAVFTVSIPHK